MKLSALLAAATDTTLLPYQGAEVEISGLALDSRKVEAGTLFCAIQGTHQDGLDYAAAAIQQGATAILTRKGVTIPAGVVQLIAENDRLATARLASAFYQPQPQNIVAVTGTDGKTSTADFFRQLMECCGHPAASLGTLGINSATLAIDAPALNTSPDPVLLHQTLQKIAQQGGTHLAIEASSHGLHQYRLHGLQLKAAAFTNLGRDHLDYHGTIEEYFKAKSLLFTELLPAGGTAVIYADDPRAEELTQLCWNHDQRVIRYGSSGDIRIADMQPLPSGMQVTLEINEKTYQLKLGMIGDFQVQNICAALGLAMGCGFSLAELLPHLSELRPVRGRLELAGKTALGAAIYVDYAHTPAALEKALRVMRHHCQKSLSVVFGCGGDRDKGKRPEMGAVACKLADKVYLADDNPRSEQAATIRAEILAGCTEKAQNIGDRREAIRKAIRELGAGDILLIAGKGHETYQILGNQTLHFDDAEEVRKALENR
jgi:UDP-N-acetylmuramoyl-L-alanyl-D-glutamate--2,6-diaminopimelate ligase